MAILVHIQHFFSLLFRLGHLNNINFHQEVKALVFIIQIIVLIILVYNYLIII